MNQRILKKQLGIKSTMKLRDYYGARVDEDRKDDFFQLNDFCDVRLGDFVFIISFIPSIPKPKKVKK